MRTRVVFAAFMLAVVSAVLFVMVTRSEKVAQAGTPAGMMTSFQYTNWSPVQSDPIRANGIIGTSPLLAIANASSTTSHTFYRYDITNTHASNKLCWSLVGLAADCASSGITCTAATTQGVLVADTGSMVMPTQTKSRVIEANKRLCVVADASSTTYHIERTKVE